ncbi:hypothetical protein [Agromyces laixinhei]|uniref:hypothetical protein n=1 Tax=Agromyces laixinhei TaxID=2585717 RepID=UPI0012EE42AC|nr:hypothetical protein [Agromyces laixinhei]
MSRARLNRRRASSVAAAFAAALALAACTPAATPLPEGLSAQVKQGRLDVEARRLVVRIENAGGVPVTVERLEIASPSFTPAMVRDEPFEVGADDALEIRVPLSETDCAPSGGDADSSDAAAPVATVVLDVTTESGAASGELTADDPFDTLARVVAADCLAESVERVAAIVMPEHLRVIGSGTEQRAFIDVEVVPAASARPSDDVEGSFVIDRVHGTTLLSAESGAEWPLGIEVAAGGDPVTITLPVRPARCDAHGVADDKRGTILPFEIRTSDGRAGRLDRSSGDALKAELYAYYGERCGLQ